MGYGSTAACNVSWALAMYVGCKSGGGGGGGEEEERSLIAVCSTVVGTPQETHLAARGAVRRASAR